MCEVLVAVVMKSCIFWDMTPCSPLKINRRFRGTCFRIYEEAMHETSMKQAARGILLMMVSVSMNEMALYYGRQNSSRILLPARACLLGLLIDADDAGSSFLRNYTASHAARR
jgi:hypothetical protein